MAATLLSPLPRYTGKDPDLRAWTENLILRLESWSRELQAPVGESWVVNGTTIRRDIDPAVLTTIAQVVDALGTMAQDLAKGAPLSVT